LFYVKGTMAYHWSRNVLVHQIESDLYKREGKSLTNFVLTLPELRPAALLRRRGIENEEI
jgi:predicted nuclease of restriction endonuclease-like (RecB) superfamily